MERNQLNNFQLVSAFIDCQGFLWTFTPHLKPDGKQCTLDTPRLKKIGRQVIITDQDRQNNYGQCQVCRAELLIPKEKITSNC